MMPVHMIAPLILIDDADEQRRQGIVSTLEAEGYDVQSVETDRMLDVVQTRLPSLIILGTISAPASAFELCSQLRGHPERNIRRVPVIMIVDGSDSSELDRVFDAGATDYVRLPLHIPTLILRVRRIIEASFAQKVEAAERKQRILAEALRDTAAVLARTFNPHDVMGAILETVGRVVSHRLANIMLIDDGQVTMRYQRGYTAEQERAMIALRFSVDDKPFCDTIRTGKPYVSPAVHAEGFWRDIPELEWIESYISTPIRAYDQVIGFLNLYADMQNAFTAEDADHLQAFADQAAIAIENAQLYDAISRDAAEMRSLHRATSFLFSTNTFTSGNMLDIGARIAQAIVREFPRVNAAVYMIDPGASILSQMASGGWIELEAQRVVPLTPGSVYYQAVMEGEITVRADLNDATRDPLLDSRTRAHALIPLVGMGTRQTVGLLDLQSREPNAFTEQSLRILEAFAVRVAALIENLRLYQEIQRRVQERTAELNRVKERVEAILNHSSDAILMIRPDGMIQQTNAAFDHMFRCESEEVYGRSLMEFATPVCHDSLRANLQRVIAFQETVRLEIVARRMDGTVFDADVMLSPILQGDHSASAVCSLRDISEHKQMERDLRQALEREREINDLRTRFIARASHEFRTPLAMIQTASDMLQNYHGRMSNEQLIEKFDRMRSAIQTITALLDDLLTLSRAEAVGQQEFQPSRFPLRHLLESLISEVQHGIGQGHVLDCNLPPESLLITADKRLLRQILVNLMSNAVKYSPKGSIIRLEIAPQEDGISFFVRDTGMGIPQEDHGHIFEPFHRAGNVEHIEGTGLGLAIVKQSVDLHRGEISLESTVGVGTTFRVFIPQPTLHEVEPGSVMT
ncbi:ATP-binding protein [Geitlerinema splendidum]|jgi:PAS domain S-box-containing protein|nr:ATP-binding protein [Geitlerinema splendidum]